MKFHGIIITVCLLLCAFSVGAEGLPQAAQRMLDDLGSSTVQQQNNGKTFRCRYGGTKKITISFLDGSSVFSGDYNYCREPGLTRDGHYEIIVKDWEIVGQSSSRSINGELFDAAISGDTLKVSTLIKKHADINFSEPVLRPDGTAVSNWTPLMSAAMNGDIKMLRLLMLAGAWVNYMNGDVVNALWIASDLGSLEIVKYLAEHGANVNNSNRENTTSLMVAARGGHLDVVKYLLSSKVDINRVHKDGDSALMVALAYGKSIIAKYLIASGADVNIKNKFGVTALTIAVAEGNYEMVCELLARGADASSRIENGKTLMDIALIKGNSKVIDVLTKYKH